MPEVWAMLDVIPNEAAGFETLLKEIVQKRRREK